jgi:hypothetical protein
MAEKHPNKSNDGKRKSSDKNHHNFNGGRGSNRHETLLAEDAEDVKEAAAVAEGEETIVSIYRMSNVTIVARRATILLIVPSLKRTMNVQTWFPKRISKTCFKLQ